MSRPWPNRRCCAMGGKMSKLPGRQIETSLHRIILDHLRPVWPCCIFRNCLVNGCFSKKKCILYYMCVVIAFMWKSSPSRNNSSRYYYNDTVLRSSCKVLNMFGPFYPNLNFLTDCNWNSQFKSLRKTSTGSRVVPCGLTGKRTDRRTDTTKLIFASRTFENTPN